MKACLKPARMHRMYPVKRLRLILEAEWDLLNRQHIELLTRLEQAGITEVTGTLLNEFAYPVREEGETNQWRTPELYADIWMRHILRRQQA